MKNASYLEFIFLFSILTSLVALPIDIVLPAFDDIASEFNLAHDNDRQWVISALMFGLFFGQLIVGPLSDHFGRRPLILGGLLLFAAGSLICHYAENYNLFLAGRFLQGFGAAGPRGVSVAVIRDLFHGPAMASVLSLIMTLFILVPVVAPGLGQVLLWYIDWRGIFLLLLALSFGAYLWFYMRQEETLKESQPLKPGAILQGSFDLFRHYPSLGYALAGSFSYGGLMGYILSAQQIFQDVYNLGDSFPFLFGMCALSIAAATFSNSWLVRRFPMDKICLWAVIASSGWSGAFLIYLLLIEGSPGLNTFLAFLCPCLFTLGLIYGNFQTIVLRPFGRTAGLVSSIAATKAVLISTVFSIITGAAFNGTLIPVTTGFFTAGLLSLFSITMAQRFHLRKSRLTKEGTAH